MNTCIRRTGSQSDVRKIFHCTAVKQSNAILDEYNVRTAGQLVSRVGYDVFTATEH